MARVICSLLALVLLTAGTTARDPSLETAKQHFDEGQSLFVAGKYKEATAEFLKAYEAKPFPAFLFNIAVCYEKDQDFAKALHYYGKYLDKDPTTADRAAVLSRMASIRQHLAPAASQPAAAQPAEAPKLPPLRPKGLVIIESKPEGAAIYLGDKRRGIFTRTPFTGTLPQGQHSVVVELRKFKPERKTFYVRADRMVYLYFALSAEEYLGWIEVKANVPGADVFFDQKKVGAVGRTPYSGFLRPGKRTLFVERPGYQPVSRVIEVTAGKDHEVTVDLEKVSFGWLRVTGETTRGSRIIVDGKPLPCATTPCKTELVPGQHEVQVQRKGWKSYSERITVRQAAETQLAVRLMPRPPRTKAYVSFGVSGSLLLAGLVCGVLSKDREPHKPEPLPYRPFDSEDPRLSSGKVLSITANALFAAGALVGGLGLYYMFRNEGPDSYGEAREHQIAVTPSLGPGGAGLSGTVKF